MRDLISNNITTPFLLKKAKRRSRLCILFPLLALISLAESLYSETIPLVDDDYSIQEWMADDGLPRNTITSITQTPDGFMWLGTPFSLIRFDGIEFREYGLEQGNRIDAVRFITSNESGEIFLSPTNQPLTKFKNGKFKHLSAKEEIQINFHSVTTGPDDTVWAIDGEGVIYKVVDEKLQIITTIKGNFRHDVLFNLDVGQDEKIWFSRGEFYGYYRPGQQAKVWRLRDEYIKLSISNDGTVWILTKKELRRLVNDASGESDHVVTLPIDVSWGKEFMIDSHNRIWMGINDRGLFLWENGRLKKFEMFSGRFWSIYEDRDGSIWIGLEGRGLYQINNKLFQVISPSENPAEGRTSSIHKNLFTPFSPDIFKITDGNESERIQGPTKVNYSTIWKESDNSYWAGTHNGRLYQLNEQGIQEHLIDPRNQPIRLLFMDSKKNVWAGGFDWGLRKIPHPYESIEHVLSDIDIPQNIIALAELPNGQIFAGSRSGSIFSLEGEKVHKFGRESGLEGSGILSLLHTSTGRLIAGTSGNGLAILDNEKFHYIGTDQGLFDPVVSQMVEDEFGFLWIGSARGIFRISLSDMEAWLNDRTKIVTSVIYGKTHGLSNIEVSTEFQPGASRASDGIVEFATNKGVVRVNPKDIESVRSEPKTIIDSVQIDDLKLPGNGSIRTLSGFQRMSFHYTAPHFISPGSIQFRCSMEGYDDDWLYLGKERYISYPKIPPGDYTFKISASDQNGEWSDNYAAIPIIVVPRWWETLSARASFLILFVAAIGFVVRMILIRKMQATIEKARQETVLERERSRISKDLHDDLGARLTEIAFMADIAPKNPSTDSADESTWNSIAKRARQAVVSLDETVWVIDPERDYLEQFVVYVVQYTTEFCERLDLACRFDIPKSLPALKLEGRTRHHLFLAFKEALNNSAKHATASLINIAISFQPNKFEFSISDNGSGLNMNKVEAKKRHGIANMRDRLERIGGQFNIASNPETGTTITLTLALKDK